MRLPDWIELWLSRRKRLPAADGTQTKTPLREFVYLDEVSLRSLLSSQRGEVTDTTSEQTVAAQESDTTSMAGLSAAALAKTELKSRYQTSNSNTLQTSRKATVQSWFRDFHSLPGLRRIEPVANLTAVAQADDLLNTDNPSIKILASELYRGDLVEFKVRLTADPVYRFGTLMSEFSGMADDSPVLFAGNNAFALLGQMEPVNRILQRLLAGLIPVRAKAIDYVSVIVDGEECIVHRAALGGIEIESRPLELVGVTEHLAYWKDIRRVLFSEAEFTMLCRVARGGLHDTWTPVKLANLFLSFAPDLVDQINTASRMSTEQQDDSSVDTNELLLGSALRAYASMIVEESGAQLSEEQQGRINLEAHNLRLRYGSVSQQRSAFSTLRNIIAEFVDLSLNDTLDAEFRERARTLSGLSLFPSLSQGRTRVAGEPQAPTPQSRPRLLDVEVVAIYW